MGIVDIPKIDLPDGIVIDDPGELEFAESDHVDPALIDELMSLGYLLEYQPHLNDESGNTSVRIAGRVRTAHGIFQVATGIPGVRAKSLSTMETELIIRHLMRHANGEEPGEICVEDLPRGFICGGIWRRQDWKTPQNGGPFRLTKPTGSRSKCFIISTPRSAESPFYDLFMKYR